MKLEESTLRRWLLWSFQRTSQHRSARSAWWPTSDSEATMLSFAFFVAAARERCGAPTNSTDLYLNASLSGPARDWLEEIWNGRNLEHWPHESLLDFSIHDWQRSNPILVTGESEVGAYWDVGDSLVHPDDYSWDFYKLLVVPSPLRLFFARVGGARSQTGPRNDAQRIETLMHSLSELVSSYANLLRTGDQIGGVLMPRSRAHRDSALLFWSNRRRLRSATMRW